MFTGLIEVTALVRSMERGVLTIERPENFSDIKEGSSIAVSGACLSVVHFDDTIVTFNVVPETLERTTLGSLKAGDRVNLERALRLSGRFEGHIVQGHVDSVGSVQSIKKNILTIKYPSSLQHLIVEKGSIAIDGVSLTVVSADTEKFSVALIPLTLTDTTLGTLKQGDRVNLEADILGKYVRGTLPSR